MGASLGGGKGGFNEINMTELMSLRERRKAQLGSDLVGGVTRLQGEGEPLAQGCLGNASEGGGPRRSEVGLGHDHIMPGQ